MATSVITLANAINDELHLHVVDAALEKMKKIMSPEEIEDMNNKSMSFSLSLARSIMRCMVSTGGQYPALYCTTPGMTAITDFTQIGISTTLIGGE